jgi:hypothetical protein
MHLILDTPCLQGFEAYVGVLLLQTALHGLASEWQASIIQQLSLLAVECQIGLYCPHVLDPIYCCLESIALPNI